MSKIFVPIEMIIHMEIIKINVIFFAVKQASFERMPPDNNFSHYSKFSFLIYKYLIYNTVNSNHFIFQYFLRFGTIKFQHEKITWKLSMF